MVNRIRELCRINRTTIKGVEVACGISNGSIARWGEFDCKVSNLAKVAEYFNVTLDYLYYGTKELAPTTTVKVVEVIPEDYKELCEVVSRLNQDGLDAVMAVASGLSIQSKYKKGRNTAPNSANA